MLHYLLFYFRFLFTKDCRASYDIKWQTNQSSSLWITSLPRLVLFRERGITVRAWSGKIFYGSSLQKDVSFSFTAGLWCWTGTCFIDANMLQRSHSICNLLFVYFVSSRIVWWVSVKLHKCSILNEHVHEAYIIILWVFKY